MFTNFLYFSEMQDQEEKKKKSMKPQDVLKQRQKAMFDSFNKKEFSKTIIVKGLKKGQTISQPISDEMFEKFLED